MSIDIKKIAFDIGVFAEDQYATSADITYHMRENIERYALSRLQKAAADAAPRWIPVGERLPEPYVTVMVYIPNSDMRFDCHDPDDPGADNGWRYSNITHWMSLPEEPTHD